MGSLGAPLTMDFVIHYENGAVLRVGEKRRIGSTGSTHDGGIQLHYFENDVYCDRNVLVGKVLQTAIMQGMDTGAPEFLRPGGLCSILTLNIHPGLVVEYRGRSIPVQMAQYMQMGQLVNHPSSNKMRLLGRMDVCACLPCCCFLPKLVDPHMLPWNQYDIYDPHHDFSSAQVPQPNSMDRGGGPRPTAPPEPTKSQPARRYGGATKVDNRTPKEMQTSFASNGNGASGTSSRDGDIQALKQLKKSGVLSHSEYISKVNQVNAKGESEMQSEIDALTRLYEDGILTLQEYETKRNIVMKLHC